ncbi:hypothetical protein [Archangium primigenium]|uniref:hypothetical protein n=1 Tax=[Archangium] primigenium TaxID=2792470 RepID=UPI00195EB9A0|nr:hypothetical protein [Archangium primigenium]MBM7115253.1 hypothetical protein [Archangium primigenium]
MKELELSRREDSLVLVFDGAFDPRAAWEHELTPLVQFLEEYAGEWMPELVSGKRRRRYSRAAIRKCWEEKRGERTASLFFYRTKLPALEMGTSLTFPPLAPELNILLEIQPLSLFADEARCQRFTELVRAWASRYPGTHAAAHSLADRALAGAPSFGRDERRSRQDGFDQIYEVSWLNVFGPRLVETVGRDRMLSTPAHRVESLPDGSVLLVTWPTLADFASAPAREAQARAHAHLRPDLDLTTVRRTLHARSAALAPVEPRFPSDVAPLLARVVDRAALHERQRQIADFNDWSPPAPEEWRPASAALPSDVEDEEQARAHYRTLAEHLVALFHTKVPSVLEATPESLTDVDFQFWREEFPRVFQREHIEAHAVPAVGAYLGQVLVHHLGGQWIPRRRMEEAQVLVGERVWFPFARAAHYLGSCQSLLDFSLTQLFQVAARHRR